MAFKKFKILSSKEDQGPMATTEEEILFNLEHIISIKPIKISRPDHLIEGYWIRTTNGKKYRATVIPSELEHMLDAPINGKMKTVNFDETSIQ